MQTQPFYYRLTIQLFLLVLIVFILYTLRELLIPIAVAMLFSFLLLPISEWLERKGLPRWLSILISILIAIMAFGSLIYFFIAQLMGFQDDIPVLKQQILEKGTAVLAYVERTFNISQQRQVEWLQNKLAEAAGESDKVLIGFFSGATTFLASIVLIPIYIFFITYFREKYRRFIILIMKREDDRERALTIVQKISSVSQGYIKGIMLDVAILSVLNSTGFLLLGLDHAILFGVLAAFLNIIPYIGVLIGSALPVLMALITKDELGYAVGVLGVCVFVQFLDNNFIMPYVVGSSVSINPFTAVFVLIASGMLWGLIGMVLSIPLTGMIKVICDNVEPLKPYGFLIGEESNFRHREPFQRRVMSHIRNRMKQGPR